MDYLQFVAQYRTFLKKCFTAPFCFLIRDAPPLILFYVINKSYLQNGNILAARTFINYFTAGVPSSLRLDDSDSVISVGEKDKVIMTKDSLLNFAQMAVLTCQRAQGDQNKVMRESWVRLCGTYQGRVAQLATPEMRSVSIVFSLFFEFSQRLIHIGHCHFLVSK